MTTPAESPELGPPVRGVEDVVAVLAAGSKADRRIGVEYERLPVRCDGSAAPFDACVEPTLADLARRGWRRYEEDGRLVALRGDARSVALEPGGQLELGTRPHASLFPLADEIGRFWRTVDALAGDRGFRYVPMGHHPVAPLDSIGRVPKRRYTVMEPYLRARGGKGLAMMKATAGIQVSLDYRDEAEAMEMLASALSVTSIVTALCANSPFVEGRPSGWASYRASTWLDCDPDRCGLLPAFARPGRTFREYAEWLLDVPLIFIERGGVHWPSGGLTLRGWIDRGFRGIRPHRYDVEVALTQVFPEARLKTVVEARGADSHPTDRAVAVAALWTGLLYDAEARRGATALTARWSDADRLSFHEAACRTGLAAARATGLARDLVRIARDGLARLEPLALRLLEPLEEIAARGTSAAEEAVRAYEAAPPRTAAAFLAGA